MPKPHQSDRHAYDAGGYVPVVQLSTDAFAAYPEAVDLAFGPYVKYGTIKKDYRNADQPGRYAPPEMIGTERHGIFGIPAFTGTRFADSSSALVTPAEISSTSECAGYCLGSV